MIFDIKEVTIRKLDEHDDLSYFTSYNEDLNDFLKNDALQYQEQLTATTYVAEYRDRIIGYVSILMDSIKSKTMQKEDRITEMQVSYYPAMKIGRLAVDKRYENKGLGRLLVLNAKNVACRLVIVDAKTEAVEFYKKLKFRLIRKHEKKKYPTMYFNLITPNNM